MSKKSKNKNNNQPIVPATSVPVGKPVVVVKPTNEIVTTEEGAKLLADSLEQMEAYCEKKRKEADDYFEDRKKAADGLEERKQDFYSFITDPNLISYYSIGKDNIPFHTIIYPAILKSIDTKFQLPTYIISCEFMNMQDEKMSKSKGNLITINDLIDEFGASTVRYFMISNVKRRQIIPCVVVAQIRRLLYEQRPARQPQPELLFPMRI